MKTRLLILINFFFCFTSLLFCQSADSVLAFRYYNKAMEFRMISQTAEYSRFQARDSAYKYAMMSVPYFRSGGFWNEYVRMSLTISTYLAEKNWEDGVSYLLQAAIVMEENKADTKLEQIYIKLSTFYQKKDRQKSLYFLNKAYEVTNKNKKNKLGANIIKLIGNQYIGMGKIDSALYYYKKALILRKEIGGTEDVYFKQISVGYKLSGNYDLAIKYLDSAIMSSDHNLLNKSKYLNDKGGIYAILGDYDEALNYCEQGIRLQLSSVNNDFVNLVYNYNNVAQLLHTKGDFIRSNEYLDEAFSLIQKSKKILLNPYSIYVYKNPKLHQLKR